MYLSVAKCEIYLSFDVCQSLNSVQLFVTPWIVAHQAPLSVEFSKQEYWSGLPFLSPGTYLTQGLNPDLWHCRQILYHLSYQRQQSKFEHGLWTLLILLLLLLSHFSRVRLVSDVLQTAAHQDAPSLGILSINYYTLV